MSYYKYIRWGANCLKSEDNSSGTFLVPPAAAGEEKGRKRGHLALRQGDCVPPHPLLNSYE